jgi:hypothetical protein
MQKWHFWGILHFASTEFCPLYTPSSSAWGIHQVIYSCTHQVLQLASTKLCSLLYSQVVYFTFTKLWAWHPPSLKHWQAAPSRAISSCIMALLKELLQGLEAFFQKDDNPVLWSLEGTSNPKEWTHWRRQAAVVGTHTRGATDRPYTWLLHGSEHFRCIASFLRSNLLLW